MAKTYNIEASFTLDGKKETGHFKIKATTPEEATRIMKSHAEALGMEDLKITKEAEAKK